MKRAGKRIRRALPALLLALVLTVGISAAVCRVSLKTTEYTAAVRGLTTALPTIRLFAGAAMHVIAPTAGSVKGSGRSTLAADATVFNSDSVVYDALVVAGGVAELDPKSAMMLQEAYRHHKTVAAWGTGTDALAAASIDPTANGVVTGDKVAKGFTTALVDAIGWHRHWAR